MPSDLAGVDNPTLSRVARALDAAEVRLTQAAGVEDAAWELIRRVRALDPTLAEIARLERALAEAGMAGTR